MVWIRGDHPLQRAIWQRDTDEALRLIAAGLWTRARDSEGRTPLYWAAGRGLAAVVNELLARGVEVNAVTICGCTPIGAAIVGGHLEIARTLLARGADPNLGRVSGYSVLHLAALTEERAAALAAAALLIEAGADVHTADWDEGYTPLQLLEQQHPGARQELEARGVLRGFW